MNLEEMEALLSVIVQDDSLKDYYKKWINAAILEVASDYDLPPLRLIDPVLIPVDSSGWLWPMPEDFHKSLFHCKRKQNGIFVRVHVHDRIDDIKFKDHHEIRDYVNCVAVGAQGEDHLLGIYPLPRSPMDLYTWYYRKPRILKKPKDTPDCIPPQFRERVIITRVVWRNYQYILDQVETSDLRPIEYWEGEAIKGVHGAPGHPGLLNYFVKTEQGRPRRTGGRDPVGWNLYRYVR
jgi:hypothetical protein